MITVKEAVKLIKDHTQLLSPRSIPLNDASGLVLAEDVFATVDVPNFNQSAMDGFAFRFDDLSQGMELTIGGEVAAGEEKNLEILPNQAMRIFTGAPLPSSADTVVMQEKTELVGNKLIIRDEELVKGRNVRLSGSEIRKNALALQKGVTLTPAGIGFLAGLGISNVKAYPKPAVNIIVTGNELQQTGNPLRQGQVYESNGQMLKTALEQLHINNIKLSTAKDDPKEITTSIQEALDTADLILVTGGVSVGDYDFVAQSAIACGVVPLFHKVMQRPGKPLFAGIRNNKTLFGLPGNPASVLTCFYYYVIKAIEVQTGRKDLLETKQLQLLTSFSKKIKLTQFLKATYSSEGVMPLSAQESYRLSSFALANCLVILPEEKMEFVEGEIVETLILPYL